MLPPCFYFLKPHLMVFGYAFEKKMHDNLHNRQLQCIQMMTTAILCVFTRKKASLHTANLRLCKLAEDWAVHKLDHFIVLKCLCFLFFY